MQVIKKVLSYLLALSLLYVGQLAPAQAAISLVTHTWATDVSNTGITPNVNTTGANTFLILVSSYQGTGFVSINNPIDSKGNVYFHRASLKTSPTGYSLDLWDCVNCIGGTSHNFTVTGTSDFSTFCVLAYSGVASSSAFGGSTTSTIGTSQTTAQAGSVTPSTNGSLVVSGLLMNDNMTGSVSIGSSLTIQEQHPHGGGEGVACADLVQSTAAAINPQWSGFNTGSFETPVMNAWYLPTGAAPPITARILPATVP